MTLSINDAQLSSIEYHYVVCVAVFYCYAGCICAECHYAECRGAFNWHEKERNFAKQVATLLGLDFQHERDQPK